MYHLQEGHQPCTATVRLPSSLPPMWDCPSPPTWNHSPRSNMRPPSLCLPQKRALCRERRHNLGLRLLTETSRALFPVSHANGGSGARLRHATALPESLRKSTPQNGERTSSQAPCEHVDPHSSCGRLSPRRQGRRGWDWQPSRSRPGWGLVCHR